VSLYDSIREGADGERRLAAAEARYAALRLLYSAVETSGLSKAWLAKKLGVGKSAVSSVLNGNGNVRITTLSDYLYEAGLRLCLSSEPIQAGHRSRRGDTQTYSDIDCRLASSDSVWTSRARVRHPVGSTLMSVTTAQPAAQDSVNYASTRQNVSIRVDEILDTVVA
jgi:hypothetical protein